MGIASLVVGIAAFMMYLMSLIPFLRWLNIVVIPLAVIGFIIGLMVKGSTGWMKRVTIAGLVLNAIVVVLGLVRLF